MVKIRLAILLEADIYHVRGEFSAVHSRVKSLKNDSRFEVEAYVYGQYFDVFLSKFRSIARTERPREFEMDGINYHCEWYRRSYLDFLFKKAFGTTLGVESSFIRRICSKLKCFDLVWTNSLNTALSCYVLGIPYIVTWHGSSIHTDPFTDRRLFKKTAQTLGGALYNFFVSEPLLTTARTIDSSFIGSVSFNGIDTDMFSYEGRMPHEGKNIIFVGNYLPVKNVGFLPELFASIASRIPDSHFQIVGNGNFENDFKDTGLDVSFMGNMDRENLPPLYRNADLVVMPSFNEGLPMVCLEATACGTPMVASRVGAIADVIGERNTVPLGADFKENFCNLCVEILKEPPQIELPPKFALSNVIDYEVSKIISTLNVGK